jgi:hypothetical protein
MSTGIYFFCSLLFASPFLAMVGILVHYQLRRSAWKRKKRKGKKNLGFYPSAAALGAVFAFMPVFYRPSVDFLVKARIVQEEKVDEDDQGDPETPERSLSRQLRRIRRGEPVEELEWRL